MIDSPQKEYSSSQRPLRTSDLAREVGVHPNTVRLYEEWGYLPAIPRSNSGYRQFTRLHMEQMKLARLAFSDPFPGRHIRRSLADLVRFAARGNLAEALEMAQQHRNLVLRELAQSRAAAVYLEQWAGGETPAEKLSEWLWSGQAARLLAVSKDTLRHWERNGLIDPPRDLRNGYRIYGPDEIGRLRVLRLLTRAGYSTMAVLRVVRSLERGCRSDLSDLLDEPAAEEDVLYAADRWLTTLQAHESRSIEIIEQIASMITLRKSLAAA